MLRSCRRCLIVTLFSEQYDSIDLISSKVIISVFIAKVAGQRTCYNMHFVGCLLKIDIYIFLAPKMTLIALSM